MLAGLYWANGTDGAAVARRRASRPARPRRRSCSPATSSSRSTASAADRRHPARADAVDRRPDRHPQVRRQAGRRLPARPSRSRCVVRRDGELMTAARHAGLRRRRRSARCSASRSAAPSTRPGPVRAAGLSASSRCGTSRRPPSSTIARHLRGREAQGDLRRRRLLRGRRASRSRSATTQALFLLALISLSLGVINLFPFLPLDGGHIFWALAEKVRGKAIPFASMERAGFVGFALVIGAVRDRLHERHRATRRARASTSARRRLRRAGRVAP